MKTEEQRGGRGNDVIGLDYALLEDVRSVYDRLSISGDYTKVCRRFGVGTPFRWRKLTFKGGSMLKE